MEGEKNEKKSSNKKHTGQASIAEETNGSCVVLIASTKGRHSDD